MNHDPTTTSAAPDGAESSEPERCRLCGDAFAPHGPALRQPREECALPDLGNDGGEIVAELGADCAVEAALEGRRRRRRDRGKEARAVIYRRRNRRLRRSRDALAAAMTAFLVLLVSMAVLLVVVGVGRATAEGAAAAVGLILAAMTLLLGYLVNPP